MRTIALLVCALTIVGSIADADAQSVNAVVLDEAPIMLFPDTKRTPLQIAAPGMRLTAMGVEGTWTRVQFEDSRLGRRNGYVESRFIRVDSPPARPQPAQAPTTPPTPARTSPAVEAAPSRARAASSQVLTFRKVDYSELQGDKERTRSARLVLDPVAGTLSFADEGGGEAKGVYAKIPYDAITKIVYEQSSHRRYGAGVMVSPLLFFTKGKKHWLTIEFQGLPALPQGFVYARLDKDNYRQVLSALRAGTGVAVEEHIEN